MTEEKHSETVRKPPDSPSTSNKYSLNVRISCGGVEETLSGSAESVWLSVNKFLKNLLPCFETAQKLVLSVDLQKLVEDSEGIIAIAKEGPCLLVPRDKLTDNETLSLVLLASYLAHQFGLTETDALSREDLQSKLSKDAKIASTRLGELVKNQMATKTEDEEYRLTTFGLRQIQRDVIPRIKAKMSI